LCKVANYLLRSHPNRLHYDLARLFVPLFHSILSFSKTNETNRKKNWCQLLPASTAKPLKRRAKSAGTHSLSSFISDILLLLLVWC